MLGAVKVASSVLVFRRIATAHVPAGKAETQVNPAITAFQTFFATVSVRLDIFDFAQMSALLHNEIQCLPD